MIPKRYTQELIQEYSERGYWKPITFSHLWDRNATLYPQREALADSQTRLTWAEATPTLQTSGDGNQRAILASLVGVEVAQQMLEVLRQRF
jgi:non-ribosomal peptide synthetase component E (peptide arylation enzyme)